ncbi:MAG TPA: ATP-binding cassette domain-containing protein, partial [Brevibacterium sp.]|nr:ATP-binding cassette domain-containing protein [Brevibacterium sp.]
MTTHEQILQLQGITKSFAGTRVLSGVDFDLRAGEIHALMGENGAGKSTLMKVLGGVHAPDSGAVVIGGERKVFANPGDAIAAGVAMIHQELSTVPEMTVAENLALGREPVRGVVLDRKR